MKNFLLVIFGLFLLTGSIACKTEEPTIPYTNVETNENTNSDTMSNQLRIKIGAKTFIATLVSNPTVTALKARLPMTVSMSELNGNEKLFNFPTNLPANASNPGNINTGDLMLYGSNVLVLFYKSFPTAYSYTRLGHIDDVSGLESAVGSGNITVTFELN